MYLTFVSIFLFQNSFIRDFSVSCEDYKIDGKEWYHYFLCGYKVWMKTFFLLNCTLLKSLHVINYHMITIVLNIILMIIIQTYQLSYYCYLSLNFLGVSGSYEDRISSWIEPCYRWNCSKGLKCQCEII